MKISGMNFASGKRSVRFRGFSAAFVLLSICACGDGAVRNVTAKTGEEAALPCKCPGDLPHWVWQKTNGTEPHVVISYKKEGNATAPEYRNRTTLKLKTGNCSLVFLSVVRSDQGLYECYYKTKPLSHDSVYLEVTDQKDPVQDKTVQNAVVASSSVFGILVIVIAAAAVFVGITRKKRHQMNGTFFATSTRSI